jgi:ribosome-associated protein
MKNRKSKLTIEHSSDSPYDPTVARSTAPSKEEVTSNATSPSSLTLSSKQIADIAIRIAIEQKGLDVFGYNVNGLTDVADHLVVISATSERHGKGIADKIRSDLQERQEKPVSVTGYDGGDWILLDYADAIIHIFHEPTRQYYEFDELWKNAESLDFTPELELAARKLRTGIYKNHEKVT